MRRLYHIAKSRQVNSGKFYAWELVGRVGLEPTTNGLKGRCSTAELPTHNILLKSNLRQLNQKDSMQPLDRQSTSRCRKPSLAHAPQPKPQIEQDPKNGLVNEGGGCLHRIKSTGRYYASAARGGKQFSESFRRGSFGRYWRLGESLYPALNRFRLRNVPLPTRCLPTSARWPYPPTRSCRFPRDAGCGI